METMEAPSKPITVKPGGYTFQLVNKIVPRSPNEPPYPRRWILAAQALAFDPETQRSRVVRFIPGIQSFWMDDDKQTKLDANYAAANAWRPEFNNGVLNLAAPQDTEKIICMLMRDEYDGKEGRVSTDAPIYTLVNKEVEFGSEVEFLSEQHKAQGLALAADLEAMKTHAIYLDIPMKDGERERKEAEIRSDYYKKASANPALFIKTIESPAAKMESQIKEAIKLGTIDLGHVKNQAHYFETKALITTLDPKEDAAKQLLEFALSKKGDLFRKTLPDLVKK
jgi:hypothetical protein